MAHERILIVDDSIEIITFLVDLLQPLGYNILRSTTGQDCLAQVMKEQPDLILLDLNMPGMSGLQVLEALNKRDCQVPVILMTLYGSKEIVVQAFRLGVRNYVSKPFDINELLVAIDWALEEGRLRRERQRLLVELSETNRKLTRRMQELATLKDIGRSVASLMPREELLRRILDGALHLSGAQVGALFLLDRDRDQLRLQAVHQGQVFDTNLATEVRDSHAQDVLRSGQPQWISTPTKRTGVTGYLGEQASSMLYVPVKLGNKAVGVIGVARLPDDRVHSPEVEQRLTTLADYAAIALQNSELYDDSLRQAQQLTTVNKIAQMIATSLDLDQVMRAIVRSVKENLHVKTATLVLVDQETDELVFEIVLDDEKNLQDTFRLPNGEGIVGWAIQNGQSARVNDVSRDPRFHAGIDQITGFHTRSVLCVPLKIADRVIGAIEAVNKLDARMPGGHGHFAVEDEELLHRAAAFIAIAIENARLHGAMREIVATQTLQDTVVTLSHYINNPLQSLMGAAESLRVDSHAESVVQFIDLIEKMVREISIVISVLRDVVSPESTVYLGSIQMIDIDRELQKRLTSATNSQSHL